MFSSRSFSVLVAALLPFVASIAIPDTGLDLVKRDNDGQATFYGGNLNGGMCSFSTMPSLPAGVYGTAMSSSNWDGAETCGGCVAVTYEGKTITAMVVDQCPGCGLNHLDLFPDAFQALANPNLGVIDVSWVYVSCSTIQGPLQIHMKSGVSQYWFSAQVVNADLRTATLEASADGGKTWFQTTRQPYNFFDISSGVGTPTAWIRVTSVDGQQIVVQDVPMQGDYVANATSNFVI